MKTNRFEDEDDDGAWRERLQHWAAPEAPPRLEQRLRRELRRRRWENALRVWGGRAAAAVLIAAAALALRLGGGPRATERDGASSADRGLLVAAEQPPRVVTETTLDGFEPVRRMTLSRWDDRRRGQ